MQGRRGDEGEESHGEGNEAAKVQWEGKMIRKGNEVGRENYEKGE